MASFVRQITPRPDANVPPRKTTTKSQRNPKEHIYVQNSCSRPSKYHYQRVSKLHNTRSRKLFHNQTPLRKNGRPSSSYSAHPAKLLHCLCWHRWYYCRNHRSLQYCKLEGSRVNARLGRKKTLQCQATTSTRSIVRAILQNSKSHGVSEWLTLYFRDTIYDRTQLMNKAKAAKPWNRTASEFERAKW